MIKVKSKEKEYSIGFSNREKTKGTINGNPFTWDIVKINEHSFHIILENKSYLAEILKFDAGGKTITVKINSQKHELHLYDRYDELLHQMGFDTTDGIKIKELKAPMPGLVIDILVLAGQTVKTGDSVIVLEAMKMENILKSPVDGIIKKVTVKKRDAVEKNAILVIYE